MSERRREARKPVFALKPADGAVGGHAEAVAGLLPRLPNARRDDCGACGDRGRPRLKPVPVASSIVACGTSVAVDEALGVPAMPRGLDFSG